MNEREKKNSLLTVRITDDEKNTLDYLSDCLGKSKSDAITRACKFFLNSDEDVEDDEKKKVRKNHQVHLRMTDSDLKEVYGRAQESGVTTSQIIRKSIRKFERFIRSGY